MSAPQNDATPTRADFLALVLYVQGLERGARGDVVPPLGLEDQLRATLALRWLRRRAAAPAGSLPAMPPEDLHDPGVHR